MEIEWLCPGNPQALPLEMASGSQPSTRLEDVEAEHLQRNVGDFVVAQRRQKTQGKSASDPS